MNPVLGVDYGRARIGLAISDELRMLAHPLETIAAGKDAIPRIADLVKQRKIDIVVVGVPKNMSGTRGAAAEEAERFVEQLRVKIDGEVVTWDERLTTVAAERALRDAGKKTRDTRGYVDQVAAQMILQGFLDREQCRGATS
ncbi:MAG: putative pre6S rRNA nuclease [Verrucomicrobiota bacterium]